MSEYYVNSADLSPSPIKLVDSEVAGTSLANIPQYNPLVAQSISTPISQSKTHSNILQQILKYLIAGIVVAFLIYYLTGQEISNPKQLVMIVVMVAIVFAVMDIMSPSAVNISCQ